MKILVKNTRSDVPITPERTTGATGVFFDNDVSENQINSEIELLTSEDLLKQVVTECGLYGGERFAFVKAGPQRSAALAGNADRRGDPATGKRPGNNSGQKSKHHRGQIHLAVA